MGLNIEEQKAVDKFKAEVVDPSMTSLIVLDFWAEWCGPCKDFAPVLEKVVAEYADKGVKLAKINVDEDKFIASQFQVQSIPTVYAMFQGQPVADLTQARTESQLKQALDQILEKVPVDADGGDAAAAQDVAQFVTMADDVLSGGDAERAAGIYAQVIDMAPDNAAAHAGLVRALVALGKIDEASEILAAARANPALVNDPLIEAANSALELASNQVDDGALAELRAKVEAKPTDMDAGFAYAEAAYAAGLRDDAAEQLLSMVTADREWNDGAARAKLLQIFEAVGLEDAWVVATRRRLSKILFG